MYRLYWSCKSKHRSGSPLWGLWTLGKFVELIDGIAQGRNGHSAATTGPDRRYVRLLSSQYHTTWLTRRRQLRAWASRTVDAEFGSLPDSRLRARPRVARSEAYFDCIHRF
nr:hypothetical protein CFP56_04579 [Quercus suber]